MREDSRILLTREQVIAVLQLKDEQIQQLVDTRQLPIIRIQGVERFRSREVRELVETYVTVSNRRGQ